MFFLNPAEKRLCRYASITFDSQICMALEHNYNLASKNLTTPFFAGYCSGYVFLYFSTCNMEFSNAKKNKYFKYIFRHVTTPGLYEIYIDLIDNIEQSKNSDSSEFDLGLLHGAKDFNSLAELGGLEADVDKLYKYLIGKPLTHEERENRKKEQKKIKDKKHKEIVEGIKEIRANRAAIKLLKKKSVKEDLSKNIINEDAKNEKYISKVISTESITPITSKEIRNRDNLPNELIESDLSIQSTTLGDTETVESKYENEQSLLAENKVASEALKIKKIKKSRNFWFNSFCVAFCFLLILVIDNFLANTPQPNVSKADDDLSIFLKAARQVNINSVREELVINGYDPDEVFEFILSLKRDLDYLDFEKLINKIHTPLYVGSNDGTSITTYNLPDILGKFTSIFTPDVIDAIRLVEPSTLYTFDNGITDQRGTIWIDKVDNKIMITALNSVDGYYE